MNVRTASAATRTANLPARGLMYSVVFGIGAWGVILGSVWLLHSLLG